MLSFFLSFNRFLNFEKSGQQFIVSKGFVLIHSKIYCFLGVANFYFYCEMYLNMSFYLTRKLSICWYSRYSNFFFIKKKKNLALRWLKVDNNNNNNLGLVYAHFMLAKFQYVIRLITM